MQALNLIFDGQGTSLILSIGKLDLLDIGTMLDA
jgi:DMSO/TMAO reductase YedYZ molybdopterin-dependent catalytic subunit